MYGSGLYMKFEEVKPVYKEYGLFFKFFFLTSRKLIASPHQGS